MAQLDTREKLEILADAAKYDASCASSGTTKRNSKDGKGLGSTEGMGICHAYAPDGRCISLLKILLTNSCIFDCHYCINRKSSNVRRARFTAKDVPVDPKGDLTVVKVKTRVNANGIVSFEQAFTEEIEEKEEAAVDGEEPKKKKVVKKNNVPYVWAATSLEPSLLEQYKQQEADMWAADKLVMDTEVSCVHLLA